LTAIDHSRLSAAWKASRRAQVGLYFRDASADVEQAFQSALELKPIKELVKKSPDREKVLYGGDWYVSATNYGAWLKLTPSRAAEAKKYIVGKLEEKPNNAAAQLELANYYTATKDFPLAEQHLALAAELEPNSPAIIVAQGNYYFMRGDREKAIAAWNNLIAKRRAGLLQYTSYFEAMTEHQLTAEALPAVEKFLSRALTKLPFSDLQPFVRQVAQAGGKNNASAQAIADMFYQAMRENPGNLELGEMLLKENLIQPIDSRAALYRIMTERYADSLLATARGGVYDEDSGGSALLKRLDNHERRFIDFLISRSEYAEARRQIKFIEDSRRELARDTAPEWMEMARAVIELRDGHIPEAVAALRNYSGLTAPQHLLSTNDNSATTQDNARYLKAYSLLVNERQAQAADQLLYDYYKQQLGNGNATIPNYSGIAAIEFRRGNNKEGLAWLQRMVAVLGNADAAQEAGKIAARYNAFNEALQWRQRAQQLNGALSENRLELARLAARVGQAPLAANTLKQLIEDRETNNSLRAQAVELLPQLASADSGTLNSLLATYQNIAFQNSADYYAQIIYAGLLNAAGRKDEARSVLVRAANPSTAAQARLMLAALGSANGNKDEARGAGKSDLCRC
jgi:tetratricopeptide (TPR) repeat protein